MKRELVSITVLLLIIGTGIAEEINITKISEEADFFYAKTGVTNNNTNQLVFFGFFGGGFIALLVVIAFVGLVFYKYKYSSKKGGAVREEDLFQKYNY